MHKRLWLAALGLASILFTGLWPNAVKADGVPDRVGLVVAFDDERHVVRTAPLAGGDMSGVDLLQRSGLGMRQHHDMICSIANVGCVEPGQDCLCALPGYWAYYHWIEDAWSYSGVGAGDWSLGAGDVDGWTWGLGLTLPDVDAAALFDPNRLASGVPDIVLLDGSVGIQMPVAGDEDADGTVSLLWRMQSGDVLESGWLTRQGDHFVGVALLPDAPGAHELVITCADPDGVNGSAVWTRLFSVEGTYTIKCPLIYSVGISIP